MPYQLVVAAALVSITLNPFVFGLVEPMERGIAARPELARFLRGAPATD
jgi:predicted Kef-type K+ transport protein